MALINCKECDNQVSTDAKACPKCGAKVPESNRGRWFVVVLATVGIVSCLAKEQTGDAERAAAKAVVEGQKTPESLAREQSFKDQQAAEKMKKEAEFQIVVAGARYIKKSAKNPDSFKLNSAAMMPSGAICYEYRATNSFNAIVPGTTVIIKGKVSQQASDWNKYCGGKSGTDYSNAEYAL